MAGVKRLGGRNMRRLLLKLRAMSAGQLLAAAMAVSIPAASAFAYDPPQRPYFDDARAAQSPANRDQADLNAARQRIDEIVAARDRQQRVVDGLRNPTANPTPVQSD